MIIDYKLMMFQQGQHPRTTLEQSIPDNISEIQPTDHHRRRTLTHPLKGDHIFGAIHINYIMYLFIPLLIFACYYSYHKAVTAKQERPFPHATITNTACHYPQDIVFRFLMLPAGSFICLVYFVVFRWLEVQRKRISYPFGIESWLFKWALASVIGFYCAIGTIDSQGYPNIHGIGAVFFFVILFIVSVALTLVVREMHNWNPNVINRSSLVSKTLLMVYLLGVTVYCLVGSILQNIPSNDDDPYLVIIEWNLTIVCLIWLLTFSFDWGNIYIALKGDVASTIKILPRTQ